MPANTVLIVGEAGSGKSTSLRTLPPEETFIINVSAKSLPMKGWRSKYTEFNRENPSGNLLNSDNAQTILQTLEFINSKRTEIKYVVIDDNQYIAANEYMRKVDTKGFEKFTLIASNMFKIATLPKDKTFRDDLFIFYLNHEETFTDSEGVTRRKAKVLGKMIDSTITYEGLFSTVLFTYKEATKTGIEYGFITNGDPYSTVKSAMEMFEDKKIPNDLMKVVETMKKYEE